MTETARIARLRRKAKRLGLKVEKSKARFWSIYNQQGWRVVDVDRDICLAGSAYDLDLDDFERFLVQY